jgi:hypothetical protein
MKKKKTTKMRLNNNLMFPKYILVHIVSTKKQKNAKNIQILLVSKSICKNRGVDNKSIQ